jgi:hypothetical protein
VPGGAGGRVEKQSPIFVELVLHKAGIG